MASPQLTSAQYRGGIEYLWPAALGVIGVVAGWKLVPAAIHMIGRGGQQETVEWALYMALLVIFPPAVWVIARSGARFSSLKLAIVVLALLAGMVYAIREPWRIVAILASAAAATLVVIREGSQLDSRSRSTTVAAIVAATFGWMCVAGLVSWGDAYHWLILRPQAAIVLLLAAIGASVSLREPRTAGVVRHAGLTPLDWTLIAILALFSFRTFPIVEFYHWGFYIGPIEQLRQGGKLLWDTPSQYGLLSILLPTLLPGTAWESFWFFQSVIFAVVAAIMYVGIRRVGRGWVPAVMSFALVFTTLFFRPRSDALLLSAQMTPSGGPVRFVPMFLLLAWLAREITGESNKDAKGQGTPTPSQATSFVFWGSVIWVLAVLWSAEAAIYCSAIWFSAVAVYLAQNAASWQLANNSRGAISGRLARLLAIPPLIATAGVAVTFVAFRAATGRVPDFHGYIEYALLYSKGGFGALPIDPTGSVWFLLLIFFAISTSGALYLATDPGNNRLVLLAALWGGAWSVDSYFTGRSHPVNVLSLAPILLYSAALTVRTLRSDIQMPWHRIVVAALVPAFAMPIVLTLGHSRMLAEVVMPQLLPGSITSQVPAMDSSLALLLKQAGVKVTDPVVLIADGRLMLPAWRKGGVTEMNERSWLPKPYEIIGSLPEARRNVYIARDAVSSSGGWLIHGKSDTIAHFDQLRAKLLEGRVESARMENDRWTVSWIGKAAR